MLQAKRALRLRSSSPQAEGRCSLDRSARSRPRHSRHSHHSHSSHHSCRSLDAIPLTQPRICACEARAKSMPERSYDLGDGREVHAMSARLMKTRRGVEERALQNRAALRRRHSVTIYIQTPRSSEHRFRQSQDAALACVPRRLCRRTPRRRYRKDRHVFPSFAGDTGRVPPRALRWREPSMASKQTVRLRYGCASRAKHCVCT
jgi:hypothetical protein